MGAGVYSFETLIRSNNYTTMDDGSLYEGCIFDLSDYCMENVESYKNAMEEDYYEVLGDIETSFFEDIIDELSHFLKKKFPSLHNYYEESALRRINSGQYYWVTHLLSNSIVSIVYLVDETGIHIGVIPQIQKFTSDYEEDYNKLYLCPNHISRTHQAILEFFGNEEYRKYVKVRTSAWTTGRVFSD